MWVMYAYPFLLSMIYTLNGVQADSHGECSAICNVLDLDDCQHESIRDQCPDLCSAAACAADCVNGVCIDDFTCECNAGFEGPNCDASTDAAICSGLNQGDCKEKIVRDNCKNLCSSESCSANCGNGVCSSTFTCDCDQGFQGPNCDIAVTTPVLRDGSDCRYPWIYVNHNLTRQCVTFLPTLHLTTNIWENARKACQDMGADLPKFTSWDQIYGLYDYFNTWRKHDKMSAIHTDHWIRGYRTSEGKSYWADDNTEIPEDLFNKDEYHEKKYYPALDERGPLETTIDKECLVFRPQAANNNEDQIGIYNKGKTPCDIQNRETAYTKTMCQKYVE